MQARDGCKKEVSGKLPQIACMYKLGISMKGTGRKNSIRVWNRPHARVSLLQRPDKGADHHAGSRVSKEVQASQPSAGRRCGLPRALFQLRAYRVPSTILLQCTSQHNLHIAHADGGGPRVARLPLHPAPGLGGWERASVCEEQVGGTSGRGGLFPSLQCMAGYPGGMAL